jgi:HYR domain
VFPVGTTTVTVTAADIYNNTNTCSFKVVVQPRLVVNLVGTDLILTWCGNPTLQSATVLTNPPSSMIWTNVPGATSPYTNSITGAEAYFRLSHTP